MADSPMIVDEKTAKQLIALIKGKNITQLSVTKGNSHITVKQRPGQAKLITPAPLATVAPQEGPKEEEQVVPGQKKADAQPLAGTLVRSELVGILHLDIEGKLFAAEGSTIEKGKPLAVITAMKINNEVKAPEKCKILKVLAANNSIVEYGTPLFEIEKL